MRRVLGCLFIAVCLIWQGILGLYLFVLLGLSGPLPTKKYLQQAHRPIASQVFASDGSLFGKIYAENRSETRREQYPQYLQDALLATEDVRFYGHGGIDYRGLARVFIKGVMLGSSSAGGGSTISQQLAKNLFPREKYLLFSTPVQKIREMVIARRLERVYPKEEIIEQYLNTVSFGEHAYGIGSAARIFFNKEVDCLSHEDAATLVGMLKAPSYYSPRLHPERAVMRRDVVLHQMLKYDMLDQQTYDSLKATPLALYYTPVDDASEFSGYFLAYVEDQVEAILDSTENSASRKWNVRSDGLKIYTTIDTRLQKHAEHAVTKQMPSIQKRFDNEWGRTAEWETNAWIVSELQRTENYKDVFADGAGSEKAKKQLALKNAVSVFSWDEKSRVRQMTIADSLKYYKRMLQTGLYAIDPHTGHIKAWIGGIDHRHFPYDHVLARRQVGSVFKPVFYTAALEEGIEPCHYYNNTSPVFEEYDNWSPRNADRSYGGCYSMQGSLAFSVNVVAARVLQDIGVSKATDMAHRLGIQSPIPDVPSIALGTAESQLAELTTAYGAFVNGGNRIDPVGILRIEDRHGNVLYSYQPFVTEQVISDTIAQTMLNFLELTVSAGTARGLRSTFGLYNLPLAGKTGTTQSHTDGWYIGIMPNLVAGVWVGADDPRVHFKTLSSGQGASTAMLLYGQFVQNTIRDPAFAQWKKAEFYEDGPSIATASCPHYSFLTAGEMEMIASSPPEDEEPRGELASFMESLFSGRNVDPEQAERNMLRQLQEKLDKTVVKLKKQGKSATEISRELQEIREMYQDRIRKLKEKHEG